MDLLSPVLIPFLIPLSIVLVMLFIQTLLLLAGLSLDAITGDYEFFNIDHHGHYFWDYFLNPLGIGIIPFSIIWETYFLAFGICGLISSFVLSQYFPITLWYLSVTVPTSLILGWYLTKFGTRIIIPFFVSGTAESTRDMIGKIAKVTSLKATPEWGEVDLNINGVINHMIVMSDGETLEKGTHVVITNYNFEKQRPIVSKYTKS